MPTPKIPIIEEPRLKGCDTAFYRVEPLGHPSGAKGFPLSFSRAKRALPGPRPEITDLAENYAEALNLTDAGHPAQIRKTWGFYA